MNVRHRYFHITCGTTIIVYFHLLYIPRPQHDSLVLGAVNLSANITQQSDVDDLPSGRYIFQDSDVGLGFTASGAIYVTNQNIFKTQIAITYSMAHSNEIYSRTFHTSRNPQWTPWKRYDGTSIS